MSLVNAKEMLLEATKGKYSVGAFNITNLIQMEAVVEAAVDKKAPLIIQTSVTPSKFLGRDVLVAIYKTLAESAPIPICLHLDHCTDVEYSKKCADAGREAAGGTRLSVDCADCSGCLSGALDRQPLRWLLGALDSQLHHTGCRTGQCKCVFVSQGISDGSERQYCFLPGVVANSRSRAGYLGYHGAAGGPGLVCQLQPAAASVTLADPAGRRSAGDGVGDCQC